MRSLFLSILLDIFMVKLDIYGWVRKNNISSFEKKCESVEKVRRRHRLLHKHIEHVLPKLNGYIVT